MAANRRLSLIIPKTQLASATLWLKGQARILGMLEEDFDGSFRSELAAPGNPTVVTHLGLSLALNQSQWDAWNTLAVPGYMKPKEGHSPRVPGADTYDAFAGGQGLQKRWT